MVPDPHLMVTSEIPLSSMGTQAGDQTDVPQILGYDAPIDPSHANNRAGAGIRAPGLGGSIGFPPAGFRQPQEKHGNIACIQTVR
jgi:hypothetical protein